MRLLALVTIASSLFSTVYGFCGSNPGSKEQVAKYEEEFQASLKNISSNAKQAFYTVPVRWNIFFDQNNPNDGNYPDAVIQQTINVVNNYYQSNGLGFTVVNVQRIPVDYRTLHSFAFNTNPERQLKQRYRRGGPETLNIYTVGNNPNNPYAGWATFPRDYSYDPSNDGIVYIYDYLPGGSAVGSNTGKIMAHEVGHWVGLYHTFQDGCQPDPYNAGDYVADTAAEAGPASGCPRGQDSCPTLPGPDPVQNMMDYSNDACRTGFTPGQYARMRQQLPYRGIYI
ncbi:hypothetical protein NLI96_g7148 [Meripilus lineatus]|uniref:Peptidase M43 pregnancy-associated plasma-A domain-containing protein n=1 Tax=Meripilus lineatus TaxID=2056292 RepID=A0AAD5V1Z4_9APHY|nr:hypothetical protein NLI96_g7148 [Physisporinus lineatus]